MPDLREQIAAGDLSFLPPDALTEWVVSQRWFGSKARDVAHLNVLEAVPLRLEPPMAVIALVEARFHPGTHELYQLVLGFGDGIEGDRILELENGVGVVDGVADPRIAKELLHRMHASDTIRVEDAECAFRWVAGELPSSAPRPIGVEQSNSSVVFGEEMVLKVFRRIEPGISPELELLRFLTTHGFEHIAPLAGYYEHAGRLVDATLGVLQGFISGARDGWELGLEQVATDPDGFVALLTELGRVTGTMHSVLGSDGSDPDFAPEQPSTEAMSLLLATVEEEIERVFRDLPAGLEALDPIRGRGQDVRELLSQLAGGGGLGKTIRHHGDFHLGQTLLTPAGSWVILDFEGEPARPLSERRRKRSPLRDVAGMLRSFAYVVLATEQASGGAVPEGFERRAREAFLSGYFEVVDPSLMPPGEAATRKLLDVFELEKAVYELQYEVNNRPDWVAIPVAGIRRLLEEAAA